MKDSSKSIKTISNDDDDARRLKRKSKKRRRDRSMSASSSDSDDSYTKRKRRRKEAKRKKDRRSSSDDDSTLRRKGRKRSRKSEGEYRKKSSKVKQKRRTNTRSRRHASGNSTSDYSSSESCSTCRDSYGSDEESWYKRSKREEIVRKGGSKRAELKKESWKGSGREVNRHSSGNSPSCSECRANPAEATEDARGLIRKGNEDQAMVNEGFVVSQFYEDGVSGKDNKCHANHEDGAEDATERKYIDENERWEMGADSDIIFGDSSNIMKLDGERDPENGNSPHAPNIVHDGRGSQDCPTNSHKYEIGSNHCQAGDEDGTSINIGSSDDRDLEAILRQKALENLKRLHKGKTQTLVKEHADGGGLTLSMAKTVGEGTGRTSSIKASIVAEGIPDSMLERGHSSGIPGVEDCDHIGGKTLSNYSDSSRARNVVPSIRISTVCNNHENNKNSKVTEVKKAGGGASGNKNSATEQNISQKVPHQAAVSKGTPATMSRERETLLKESIVKPAASVTNVVHGLEANGTNRVPSVAPGCSDSSISNFEQSGSKSMATEASQYEQKTMSVMRGGEMVQVSYKVYIPKKAPALARRQLQR